MARSAKSRKRLRPAPPPARPTQHSPTPATVYSKLTGPWYLHAAAMLVLIAGTFLLYRRSLDLGFFHLDDVTYIANNPWIKGFTLANFKYVLTTPYFANYSPVHLLSYMIDYQIAGESPRAFHVSNLLWGGLVAAFVYLLGLVLLAPPKWGNNPPTTAARLATSTPLLAFLAATLFLTHPAHVEANAWISTRKDLVAAAFALPAMLAYFLHRRNPSKRLGYIFSLVLFTLAVAGKLSVVVLPAMLFVFDWLVERRRGWSMVLDKIPFGLVALPFALRTFDIQPSTQQTFNFYALGYSTLNHLWLMTGLGDHVLFRSPPDLNAPFLTKLVCVVGPLVLILLPLRLRRGFTALPVALFYAMLLALLPSQMLSFVYPVADRYVFFPSVAAVLLIGWGAGWLALRLAPTWRLGPAIALVLIAGLWAFRTHSYLGEWSDPRSVWFAARSKSDDRLIYQYLGSHYQDQADQLSGMLAGAPAQRQQAIDMARLLWHDREELPALLQDWQTQTNSPLTATYRSYLRDQAIAQLEEALRRQGSRLTPNLHFRLGKVAMENNDFDRARQSFLLADRQAQAHTSKDVREEVGVRSHHALGLLEWKARNYSEALRWVSLAEQEQARFGINWIPDISTHRRQLEQLAGRSP